VSEKPPDVAVVNRELTRRIAEAGERLGFEVATEYPVPGARIDVVWSLRPPDPIPHFDGAIPVVGFEIESSWRTRKHVKGDFLNLQDAGLALGIIVLAGSGKKDDSLRQFARVLADRPGTKVLIWTDHDVLALSEGRPAVELPVDMLVDIGVEPLDRVPGEKSAPPDRPARRHTGKYRPLWEWLMGQEHRPITVTFGDIERVLGFPLPDSCRTDFPPWHGYAGSAVARAIIDAGWRARQVQLNSGTVTFVPQR
jgi:hypothetical protein